MVPDVRGLDRAFDYFVPAKVARAAFERSGVERIGPGHRVRVPLHGRRVNGWVVAVDVEPPPGVTLLPVLAWRGLGPPPGVVALAEWAAWRWAGTVRAFLAAASPPKIVWRAGGEGPGRRRADTSVLPSGRRHVVTSVLCAPGGRVVVRLPPPQDPAWLIAALARSAPGRSGIVVVPERAAADELGVELAAAGLAVAKHPEEWAAIASGGRLAVGTRSAVWAPVPDGDLAFVAVVDAEDELLVEEQAPTWSAWQVAAARARGEAAAASARGGLSAASARGEAAAGGTGEDGPGRRRPAPLCVTVSSCPTAELAAWGTLVTVDRTVEREGWAPIEVVDMRKADPAAGLYGPRAVALLRTATAREGEQVCVVVNRTGRVRLLACRACRSLQRCERCGSTVRRAPSPAGGPQPASTVRPAGRGAGTPLECPRCGLSRPGVCQSCGAGPLAAVRAGVTHIAEDIRALLGGRASVTEVSGEHADPTGAVLVGTHALLHRLRSASAVLWLDFDQELLAPRWRAAERALVLLARSSRIVGGRVRRGRVLLQSRWPDHPVIDAALHADPGRFSAGEAAQRAALRLPPSGSFARLDGKDAALVARFAAELAGTRAVEVLGPASDGSSLVVSATAEELCDALRRVPRPSGVRVGVEGR